MSFYIDNLECDIQSLLEKQNKMFESIRIKKGSRDTFDVAAFYKFQENCRKTIYELDAALSYWQTVFESEHTVCEKSVIENQTQNSIKSKNKQQIISNYILNNYFLH
jgi:hypothetical protein